MNETALEVTFMELVQQAMSDKVRKVFIEPYPKFCRVRVSTNSGNQFNHRIFRPGMDTLSDSGEELRYEEGMAKLQKFMDNNF